MLAFIYDCTPRQRENGIHKNDCMMGIPTETPETKAGRWDLLPERCWSAATRPPVTRFSATKATTNTSPALTEAPVCSCWLDVIKALSCQGQGQGCSGVSPAQHCTHSSCCDYGCSLHVCRAYKEEDKLLWVFDNSPAAAVDLCSVYDITLKTKGKWIQQ